MSTSSRCNECLAGRGSHGHSDAAGDGAADGEARYPKRRRRTDIVYGAETITNGDDTRCSVDAEGPSSRQLLRDYEAAPEVTDHYIDSEEVDVRLTDSESSSSDESDKEEPGDASLSEWHKKAAVLNASVMERDFLAEVAFSETKQQQQQSRAPEAPRNSRPLAIKPKSETIAQRCIPGARSSNGVSAKNAGRGGSSRDNASWRSSNAAHVTRESGVQTEAATSPLRRHKGNTDGIMKDAATSPMVPQSLLLSSSSSWHQ